MPDACQQETPQYTVFNVASMLLVPGYNKSKFSLTLAVGCTSHEPTTISYIAQSCRHALKLSDARNAASAHLVVGDHIQSICTTNPRSLAQDLTVC